MTFRDSLKIYRLYAGENSVWLEKVMCMNSCIPAQDILRYSTNISFVPAVGKDVSIHFCQILMSEGEK